MRFIETNISNISKERMHKFLLLCSYIGMLSIQLTVTVLNNMDYYHYFPFSIPRNLLKYLFWGALIYLLPYEKIAGRIRKDILGSREHPALWGKIGPHLNLVFDCCITLLTFGILIYMKSQHPWSYYRLRVTEYLPIIFAMFTLIRFLQIIKNSWLSYFVCCFVWAPLTVILVHLMTKRFVFSGVVGISLLLTYWIGIREKQHKTNWLRVILCLFVGTGALLGGLLLTHNLKNLLGIFYPKQYISDSAAQMRYVVWANPLFTVPENMSIYFFDEHPLTAIHMYLGTLALILFLAFQIVFIVFLHFTWKDAMKKSQTTGLLFGCISLLFVGTYLYTFLGDIGALPATTIDYLFVSIDVPLLFFLLRLTNPLPVSLASKSSSGVIDKFLAALSFEPGEDDYEYEDELDYSEEEIDNRIVSTDYSLSLDTSEKKIQEDFHSVNGKDENHGQ